MWDGSDLNDKSILVWTEQGVGDQFIIEEGGAASFAGNVTVDGMLTAREFHTQFVSASIVYQSGSTQFGDTTDDMHSFTGSLQVSGSSAPFHANMGGTTPSIGGGVVGVFQRSGVSGCLLYTSPSPRD